jgi:hypothetical protein
VASTPTRIALGSAGPRNIFKHSKDEPRTNNKYEVEKYGNDKYYYKMICRNVLSVFSGGSKFDHSYKETDRP